MIEVIAAIARWFQLAANMTLLGSCVFLAIAGSSNNKLLRPWIGRVEQIFPWLVVSIVIGLLAILATSAAQATGDLAKALQPAVWLGIIEDTRMGHIWAGRVVLVFLLFAVVLYLRNSIRAHWHYILCAIFATFPLIAGSLVSHTAAEEFSFVAVLPYALHIVLGGIWLGSLPAFLILLVDYLKKENIEKLTLDSDIQTLKRFSSLALPVMILIITTGILVADRTFDGHYAALVATPYGWMLSTKLALLALILMIANNVRSTCLPTFTQARGFDLLSDSAKKMRKWVKAEYLLALILLLSATILANITPAKLAVIEEWPLPFRFSIVATWGSTAVVTQVWLGFAIFVMGIIALLLSRLKKWNLKRSIGISLTLIIAGFAVALPPLSIEAYPETYRKTPIPFDAVSIAHGATLYNESCVACHGPQGKGNGILSRTFSTVMPDMLTEPHTEEHTAGDFYHWLSYGIKNTDMPGFADKFSVDDRWDLVNYIHALSRGYQARILTPEVVPNKPYVMPPDFFYGTNDGTSGLLQDFRKQESVLLVTFSWPQSKDRLVELSQEYSRIREQNTIILAASIEEIDAETRQLIASEISFPLITEGAAEIAQSYSLYRRTLSRPDFLGLGTIPDHMEYMIDRYGYLRARWIPMADQNGWDDIDLMVKQLNLLDQEMQILPLAKNYVD
ncbi:MAG: CopD family protein [Nitrosomonas sp.]|nr:CopD family protein [Nitrosomonas sp.]MDP1950225.1 CopD family protein [Nitrosomonas sp.]